MTDGSRMLTIEDSIESSPFALVDDLVVVVRTPRSSDFVTVEVGRISNCLFRPFLPDRGVYRASRPAPCVADGWRGGIHLGEEVVFEVAGCTYRLMLEGSGGADVHLPWARYQFRLERRVGRPAHERAG